MTSRPSVLLAKPAYRSVPQAAQSTGAEAIELAASAGLHLDDWQCQAVCDLLGEDSGGFWAATSGGLIAPRQNGKGAVIEALELAWLFLCEVDLIFHSAHLFATAQDAFRRIKSLIRDTPDLDSQVKRYSEAHGQEGIELHSGQRLRFVARSKSGGRGFPAPVVVLDEAFNLSTQAMAALVPTMAAQPNPFLLVTSSAPIDDPCSDVLRQFMKRSRSGEVDRRCYVEFSADPLETDEKAQLAQANPGYGLRLNDDVIAEERELLTPAAFLVERLGIVDLEGAGMTRYIPPEDWQACQDPRHRPGPQLRYALDVDSNSRGETWASVAVSDGTHAEIVKSAPGVGWVVGACVDKKDLIGELVVAKDSPAAALIADLDTAGVDVQVVPTADFCAASMQLLEAVNAHQLRHLGQPELDTAVAAVVRRDVGDGQWRWSRKLSSADISPLCAVTLARFAALQHQHYDVMDSVL